MKIMTENSNKQPLKNSRVLDATTKGYRYLHDGHVLPNFWCKGKLWYCVPKHTTVQGSFDHTQVFLPGWFWFI
jgi:hypothetical protein